MNDLNARLEALFVRLTEPGFLKGVGLGNEVNFHIFDYDPEHQPVIESHLPRLLERLALQGVRALELNLYGLMLEELQSRNLLEQCFKREADKGSGALEATFQNILRPEVFVNRIRAHREVPHDLVLVTGVGAVYPMVQAHTLLNNLQSVIAAPLVLFFPGHYDSLRLKLFGKHEDKPYYRAFPIAPRKPAGL